ncbi:arsenate reductase [Undibacterium fentianense]|uniref:Arsenate reductase n=1 Tax=Undibacterium fentianense TaxID=2828728 RepID=A0A941IDF0_9BURK|nr:arsenate reductase [Undibacterium fentianense]MBR7798481.1 arsenate reductase [Undibacterium fentianense]
MQRFNKVTLFGIPNCDTVKKARVWLDSNNIPFVFHNFKKDELSAAQVDIWLKKINFETLINRKGTSWRALTDAQKNEAETPAGAMNLILANPSLIKRPVLQIGGDQLDYVGVGFNDQLYSSIFLEK